MEFNKGSKAKDKEHSEEASHKLAEQISQQCIQLPSTMLDKPCFNMGHHLQTIMQASSSKIGNFGDYLLTMAVLKLADSSLTYQVVKEI